MSDVAEAMTEAERAAFRAADALLREGDQHAGSAGAVLHDCGGAEGQRMARWIKQGRLGEVRAAVARVVG